VTRPSAPSTRPDVLNDREAAAHLGVPLHRLYALIREGGLPAIPIRGGEHIFRRSLLDAWREGDAGSAPSQSTTD